MAPRLPVAGLLGQGDKPGIRFARLGQDDLLARVRLFQQPGEMGLSFMYVDNQRHSNAQKGLSRRTKSMPRCPSNARGRVGLPGRAQRTQGGVTQTQSGVLQSLIA